MRKNLSKSQQRMYVQCINDNTGVLYNVSYSIKIKRALDKKLFWQMVDKIVERHEIFRANFVEDGGRIYQVINSKCDYDKAYVKISRDGIEKEINSFVQPFDLEHDVLFRIKLVEVDVEEYILLADFHHLIWDLQTEGIIRNDLQKLFDGQDTIMEDAGKYSDFLEWEEQYKATEEFCHSKEYWINKIPSSIPEVKLPYDFYGGKSDNSGDIVEQEVCKVLMDRIKDTRSSLGVTTYSVFYAAFVVLLYKLTGQRNISTAICVSGRVDKKLNTTAGMFVNTLPIFNEISKGISVKELIVNANKEIKGCAKNQGVDLSEILSEFQDRQDIKDVLNVLFNGRRHNCAYDAEKFIIAPAIVDVLWAYDEYKDGKMMLSVVYRKSLFYRETIERWLGYYMRTLDVLSTKNEVKVKDVRIISEEEYDTLVNVWNDNLRYFPKNKTLSQLFEEQVRKAPDMVALVHGEDSLTYAELNKKANQLANYIRKTCKEKQCSVLLAGDAVGVYMDKSINMIIGIVGIIKAGATCVPLDVAHPIDRLSFIVDDVKARMIIADVNGLERIAGKIQKEIFVIEKCCQELSEMPDENVIPISKPENLAYILYTSGSTGVPKGVCLNQVVVINLILNDNLVDFKPGECVGQFANFAFDVAYAETWGALLNGLKLALVDKQQILSADEFEEAVNKYSIDHAFFTPALFNVLVDVSIETLFRFKNICCAGEKLTTKEVFYFMKRKPKTVNLINGYGPTETSFSHTCVFNEEHMQKNVTPIGKALPNKTSYVLDKDGSIVPVGVVGELYIGGEGLAEGYLNNQSLTDERFVDNPFASEGDRNESRNLRLYKTGDLVKWLPTGELDFIGRADNQVKFRGFRIELEEIEAVLNEHAQVAQSAVMALGESSNKKLVAYYERRDIVEPIDKDVLRRFLASKLPNYMIPSGFVFVEKFVMTLNGKIDRRSLPKVDSSVYEDGGNLQDEMEIEHSDYNNIRRNIRGLWKDILGVDFVSLKDDFFEMGGNSLLAAILAKKISDNIKRAIPSDFIYQHRTIEKQATALGEIVFSPYLDLIHFNKSDSDKVLILVHPTGAGAEVYYSMSNLLKDYALIIGVNAYNINNPEKISGNLNDNAEYYFKALMKDGAIDNKKIYLGGWSSGGNIALKLAEKICAIGGKVQRIFLFDTFNCSIPEMKELKDTGWRMRFLEAQLFHAGIPQEYIENMRKMNTMETKGLAELCHDELDSHVCLFKCAVKRPFHELIEMTDDEKNEADDISDLLICRLANNGWENVLSNLEIIEVQAHHGNIISDRETLSFIADAIKMRL